MYLYVRTAIGAQASVSGPPPPTVPAALWVLLLTLPQGRNRGPLLWSFWVAVRTKIATRLTPAFDAAGGDVATMRNCPRRTSEGGDKGKQGRTRPAAASILVGAQSVCLRAGCVCLSRLHLQRCGALRPLCVRYFAPCVPLLTSPARWLAHAARYVNNNNNRHGDAPGSNGGGSSRRG